MSRTRPPVWASWIAVIAGVASFIGWILGMWLETAPGNLVWVVSSLGKCMWTLWFGAPSSRPSRTRPSETHA